MKKIVEVLAKYLVDDPAAVEVREFEGERALIVELKVADDDMGKIIGKQGKIARAIRSVARAKGNKLGKKVNVEIMS
jgi:predicted RNA-binding protein YlqC (UPF0109 family)